ncbi:MAG: helix-hairpin-helix domain-containing protein [Planctomycetota bacterium]|nr:helix-hairpin-helix domain-containing protein [Planctomycetota bacterium]
MTPVNPTASEKRNRRSLQSIGLVVLSCVSVMAGVCLFLTAAGHGEVTTPYASERVNPNTAPVGSLIRLPGIGAARARAIVIHRDDLRRKTGDEVAFHTRDDLQRIKGIGPRTVAEIVDWLAFDVPVCDERTSCDEGPPRP